MKTPITFEIVQKAIAEHICISLDQVKPDATLEDLDVDSLDEMEIIMFIEDECNVEINDSELIAPTIKVLNKCTVTEFTDILIKASE